MVQHFSISLGPPGLRVLNIFCLTTPNSNDWVAIRHAGVGKLLKHYPMDKKWKKVTSTHCTPKNINYYLCLQYVQPTVYMYTVYIDT